MITHRFEKWTEVPTMISMRTDRIMWGIVVAGLLTATAACAQTAETRQPPALRRATPATVSSPAAPPIVDLREQPPAPQAPAIAPERPPNDADDPRAVIDWLLNPSSVRGR